MDVTALTEQKVQEVLQNNMNIVSRVISAVEVIPLSKSSDTLLRVRIVGEDPQEFRVRVKAVKPKKAKKDKAPKSQ
jgi:hypothetical protein